MIAGETKMLIVQGVRSPRIEMQWADAAAVTRTELVFIGYHPSRRRVVGVAE